VRLKASRVCPYVRRQLACLVHCVGSVVPLGPGEVPPSIVITATSPGLAPATITIETSVDPADSVLAVRAC
jgi:hypothetical protein